MTENTDVSKKPVQRSIAKRSLLSMLLMAVLMIIGTSAAASLQLYDRMLEIYQDYAYSYAKMASTNIDGDLVEKYLQLDDPSASGEKALVLEDKKADAVNSDDYKRIHTLLETSVSYANLRYIYVVVPREEDMVYLWDVFHLDVTTIELSEQEAKDLEQQAEFLEHDTYTKGEKEAMMAVMNLTWDDSLFLDHGYLGHPLATAFSPVFDSDNNIVAVVGVDLNLSDMRGAIIRMCLNVIGAIFLILFVCMIIYYFLIQHRIIRPIVSLKKAVTGLVDSLEKGNSFQADIHTNDEIEALAHSFEEMDVRLKHYLLENAAITAERERLKTELDLARRIQADMLPSEFPAFPDKKQFDIYASMKPAKEVGGDFYDFFLIDEDHLALVIADVSGKGIPAALFMMMSKIMLQNYTLTGMKPGEVLEKVNNQICRSNKEEMFVTVWLGVLDLSSGMITAANAGHEYPMLKQPDGEFELVRDPHGLVIGGMEDLHYKEYEMKMEPGSTLFVYTDGIAEATDLQNNMFGTERTLSALNAHAGAAPEALLNEVACAVDKFVGEAPQFDDMTMLSVSFHGRQD